MQLLRGNSDLGPEPELTSVDEPARGVDQYRRGVHLRGESGSSSLRFSDDRFRVTGAVSADVLQGRIQGVHDSDSEIQR